MTTNTLSDDKLLQKIEQEAELNSGTVAKLDPVELIREDRRR